MEVLSKDAEALVAANGLPVDDVKLVLRRLSGSMPHLEFESWQILKDGERYDKKRSGFAHRERSFAHCHITVRSAHIATAVYARADRMRRGDIQMLDYMCEEASRLLEAASESGILLSDFGGDAVARGVAEIIGASSERIRNLFRFLRSLSGETYENQRISYGMILLPTRRRESSVVLEFDNKRFKRLTDGFSTAIILDAGGAIVELVALSSQKERKDSGLGRPWWLAPLADEAHKLGGVGVALTRGGDILVVNGRELVVSHRSGKWQLWRHADIVAAMRASWGAKGKLGKLNQVLVALYRVALELSFRRTGGLLVVAESWIKTQKVVAKGDLIGADARSEAEKALDEKLSYSMLSMDRRVVADLAGLDGALVVDRNGRIAAYGAMVRVRAKTTEQGSRTRAAISASMLGLAIKVSSDGGISVYRSGNCVVAL